MAPVLKTGVPERVPGVRIPPSPPLHLLSMYLHHGDAYTDSAGYTFSGFPAPRSSEVWPKNGAISLDMTASTKFLI